MNNAIESARNGWHKRVGLLVIALAIAAPVHAQQRAGEAPQRAGFQVRTFKDDAGNHKYSVFVPATYTPTKKWPVILFLHGAGERGTDGSLQTTIGLGPLVRVREANFPFIVVFPQNEEIHGRILNAWSPDAPAGKRALAILDQVEKDFSVDTKREILTGWSMGGYGAWQLAAASPDRWLSVVPVSGGGEAALAEKLKNVPIWAFHGAKDTVVRPDETRRMAEAVKAAGGDARYSDVPEGDHNVWAQVYDYDPLYAWMLSPKSDPAKLRPITSRPAGHPNVIPEAPFVPALDVPRALYVRMGNDMLASLADSIPQIIPRDALTGRLNDISDSTSAEGYTFGVYMSGLSYYAQLVRAKVQAYRKDRLNIQLGLSNAQVTIGGTSITGSSHSAEAGPMSIVIGHQRPVWLSFDVTPVVVDRKLRLKLVGTSFSIPDDNWYVSGPAGVSAHGFGLTREKVSSGLVSGLYGRKHMIESQVSGVVPRLVAQMEEKLDVSQYNKTAVGGLWPLPVYQPRLRMWPAEVSTDEAGVSVVLGVTAAAVDPARPPARVKVAPADGPSAADVPRSTQLQVGIAPQTLAPLSEMLVEADVARIHVADTPSKALARLADPRALKEAIPELNRYGDSVEVSSELILAGPINIIDAPGVKRPTDPAGDDPSGKAPVRAASALSDHGLAFDVPKIRIAVSIKRNSAAAEWTPFADFDFSLHQGAYPQLLRPTSQKRSVTIRWDNGARIEAQGRFAEGYQPQDRSLDMEKIKSLFAAGWDEYVHGGPTTQLDLPDIDLGYTKLRAAEAGWAPPTLYAVFTSPQLKLVNSFDKPLVYETKGPYSGWGGPYTLEPGKSHEFTIPYPMVFRRKTETGYQMFTLPAGSSSEFRTPPSGGGAPALFQAREPAPTEAKPKSTDQAQVTAGAADR